MLAERASGKTWASSRVDVEVGWKLDPTRAVGAAAAVCAIGFGVYVLGGLAVALFGPAPPGPGEPAPEFRVAKLDGEVVESGDYRGRVILLDFWATWCVGCIGATPRMNRLHADYGPRGFAVVSMNQEPDDLTRVREVVRERDIRYPVLVDPGRVAADYGIGSLPTVVLVDVDGTIRAVHSGPVAESRLRREIEALLPR